MFILRFLFFSTTLSLLSCTTVSNLLDSTGLVSSTEYYPDKITGNIIRIKSKLTLAHRDILTLRRNNMNLKNSQIKMAGFNQQMANLKKGSSMQQIAIKKLYDLMEKRDQMRTAVQGDFKSVSEEIKQAEKLRKRTLRVLSLAEDSYPLGSPAQRKIQNQRRTLLKIGEIVQHLEKAVTQERRKYIYLAQETSEFDSRHPLAKSRDDYNDVSYEEDVLFNKDY